MGKLNTQWEQFRQDYERFRQDEPTFILPNAFRQLSQLVAQFANIVKASRDLPSFQHTLPMAQMLAKATEDEDLALRILQSNWRPFDPHVYLDFDQERNGVNKLKRQVVADLNDFLAQYSISDKEINEQ